jgi:CHC2 zinc finger
MSLIFRDWHAAHRDMPGWARREVFSFLSEKDQAACCDELAERTRLYHETSWLACKRDYERYVPREKRRSQDRGTASRSSRSTRVVFDRWGDPLHAIPAREYVQALAGVDVSSSGRLRCPLPDHEDKSPSFHVYDDGWRCFGCNRGGSIIDFFAALYGLEPRGSGYREIRQRLLADLGLGVLQK